MGKYTMLLFTFPSLGENCIAYGNKTFLFKGNLNHIFFEKILT
jgi:hypothetical protein